MIRTPETPQTPPPPTPAERTFGDPGFAIRCAVDRFDGPSRSLGRIAFSLGGADYGSFDQLCVLGGVAVDLQVNLGEIDARKDLRLAQEPPQVVLERVYAAVYGEEASDEDAFWHRRLVWLEGREPYDGWRSVQLVVPDGRLIAWDSADGGFHQALIAEETYQRVILEWLAWLDLLGVGNWGETSCSDCAWGGRDGRRRGYEKVKARLAARLARERKAGAKPRPAPSP